VSQAETESRPRPRFTMNTEGKRQPAVNAAAGYSLVAGVVSTVLGLMSVAHIVGSALGVSAFLIGLWAQMISSTTVQRCVIVTGIVAAFVGMGLGIAHGGFG
jgi:TctA family transporter